MKRRKLVAATAAALCAAAAAGAWAQAKPDVLVKQRQAAMTMIGKYFGPLGAMAQGKLPYDGKIVARNAGYLEVLAQMPWDGFDASTRGEKSATLPAAFTEPEKFKAAAERMQAELGKLATVVKGGDEAAIRNQIAAVGKSCAGCHDHFREKR